MEFLLHHLQHEILPGADTLPACTQGVPQPRPLPRGVLQLVKPGVTQNWSVEICEAPAPLGVM